jgi:uncharacterized membrane protein YeaQ/YmgE (transglycosylase-associated protein family)
MVLILGWLVVGAAVAIAMTSFLSGRGEGGSTLVNLIAGAVGGFVGGYVFLLLGPMVLGPGPEFIFSMLGAAVVSVVAALVAAKVVK